MITRFNNEKYAVDCQRSFIKQGIAAIVTFDENADRRPWILETDQTEAQALAAEEQNLRSAYRRMK
jgi:hypothetical protein